MSLRSPKTKPAPELARARRLLEPLGEARPYLNGLVGAPPASLDVWRQVLELCSGGGAEALRLRGRALSFLGRPAEALEALDRAVALEQKDVLGWTWRGEARMLAGLVAGAREDLDRAVALDKALPWPRLLRATCLLTEGDCDAAGRDLAKISRLKESRAAALGVGALLEAQRGRPERGLELLDAGLKGESSGFLLAIRGLLRRATHDLRGAREDLDAAIAAEPTPWAYSQRADILNRSGFYKGALDDLKELSRLLPDSSQPHLQAANVLFDQAFYVEALEELELAIARSPEDAGLLARRARFFLVLTRLEEAERDLARVCRLEPGVTQHRYERLLVLLLLNRFEQALGELDAEPMPPPFDDYLRGYAACRRGDYERARRFFLAAAESGDGGLAERSRFYALVARVLSSPPPGPPPAVKPLFYLCGIGLRHPYQATVEVIHAIASCGVLYNNLGDPQVSEFLGLFRGEVRAVTRVFNEAAMGRVQRIVAGFNAHAPTGFVTRIHPFIYRRIAYDLAVVCQERGLDFVAYGAVSLTEISWALGDAAGGTSGKEGLGVRVFDMCRLNDSPELLQERFPAVVYCIAGPDHRRRLCRTLATRYPKEHVVYLLAGSGDREHEPAPIALGGLEAPLLDADLGAVLYVPAVEEKK